MKEKEVIEQIFPIPKNFKEEVSSWAALKFHRCGRKTIRTWVDFKNGFPYERRFIDYESEIEFGVFLPRDDFSRDIIVYFGKYNEPRKRIIIGSWDD